MRRLVTVTLVIGLGLLAGCQDGDDPDPKVPPTESSSPTPTPSPTGPVEPTLPAEAEGDDAAAAEAFVRHFWAMVNYAQASGRVEPLVELALPSCATCASGARWIADVYRRGGEITGGDYSVGATRVTPLAADDQRLFEVVSQVATTDQKITGAGSLDDHFPAGEAKVTLILVVSEMGLRVSRWDVDR